MIENIPSLVPLAVISAAVIMSIYAFGSSGRMNALVFSPYAIVHRKEYHRFITGGFIHADIPHLAFNMLTFVFFAFSLEDIIGPARFTVLYFGSLILADIPAFISNRNNSGYSSLGASGAVAAVVFAFIIYYPLNKIYIMFIPVGVPAFIYAVFYLGYCAYADGKQYGNINHSAHFWGSLSGLLFILIYDSQAVINCIIQISSALHSFI